MTALFALATSLLWGLADFGGGLLTRRIPALTVVVVSQASPRSCSARSCSPPAAGARPAPQLWFAVAAGARRARSRCSASTRRSRSARWAWSPRWPRWASPCRSASAWRCRRAARAAAGRGHRASPWSASCWRADRSCGGAPVQRQAILLTLVAAFGFGAVMALIAEASTTLTGLFLALFVQRVTNVAGGRRGAVRLGAARHARASRRTGGLPRSGARCPRSPSSASRTSRPTAPTRSPPSTARSPWPPCSPRSTRWSPPWPRAASSGTAARGPGGGRGAGAGGHGAAGHRLTRRRGTDGTGGHGQARSAPALHPPQRVHQQREALDGHGERQQDTQGAVAHGAPPEGGVSDQVPRPVCPPAEAAPGAEAPPPPWIPVLGSAALRIPLPPDPAPPAPRASSAPPVSSLPRVPYSAHGCQLGQRQQLLGRDALGDRHRGGVRSGGCQPVSGSQRRTTRAGAPATTAWSGTSPRTTAPAATTTLPPEPRAGQDHRPGADPAARRRSRPAPCAATACRRARAGRRRSGWWT